MLASIVCPLRAVRDAEIPRSVGYEAYAMFLHLVRGVDPGLEASLHGSAGADPRAVKPFTVSPLRGPVPSAGPRVRVRAGEVFEIRFTTLTRPVGEVLLHALARRSAPLRIHGAEFELLEWSPRQESYAVLHRRWAGRSRAAPRTARLEFASETTFRDPSGKSRNLPLPLPELVFAGLARKWLRYAPEELRAAVAPWEDPAGPGRRLLIRRHRLETRPVHFGEGEKGMRVGFVGDAEFLARPEELAEADARALQLLADFAFYAGVGDQTTWGMGQARRQSAPRGGER